MSTKEMDSSMHSMNPRICCRSIYVAGLQTKHKLTKFRATPNEVLYGDEEELVETLD